MSDFGLSKVIDNDTVLKSLCGTPMFVAPEILRNNGLGGSYTPQVDIWSLGVILYVCVCGNYPFYYDADDPKQLYIQILKARYEVPREIKDYLTSDVMDVLAKCLVVDPEKRITVDDIFRHKWMRVSIFICGLILKYVLVNIFDEKAFLEVFRIYFIK